MSFFVKYVVKKRLQLTNQSVCFDWLVKYALIINIYSLDDVYNVDEIS